MNSNSAVYSFDYSIATAIIEKQVTEGLEFMLGHLAKPYWPRTISTKLQGKVEAYNILFFIDVC
jgi:hypothetical protein